jgi:MFS family permease
VDYAGAALLTVSVVLLLLGLMEFGTSRSWVLLAVAAALFIVLFLVERRAADPILPLPLFRDRLFSTATAHGMLTGWALFGSISFIPLFVQSVLGTSATQAGITITPLLLGWVGASIFGTRILLRVGYRRLGLTGTTIFTAGALLMTMLSANSSQTLMMVFVTMMGIGMGLSVPSFVIAVQTSVERRNLGTATSMLQFSRSMGGTLGVSVMGAALSARLASNLNASGLDPELVARLLEPLPGSEVVVNVGARLAMADAIHLVFVIAFVAAAIALAATFFTPRTKLRDRPPENEPLPVSAD